MLSWRVFLHLRFIRRARAGLLDRTADFVDARSVYSTAVSLPFASGLLHPKIYLPMDFETRFSSEHQALMLAHERAHIAAFDLWALALAEILLALQWFNPLTYFARQRMQCDQEMACDARVLSSFSLALAPSVRLSYAELLQASAGPSNFAKRAPDQRATSPMACLWPTQHPILERISMLKNSHVAPIYRKIALAISCVTAVAVSTLVWSSNASQSLVVAASGPGASNSAVNTAAKSAVMYKIATTMVFEGKTVNPIIGVIAGHQGSIAITDAKRNSTRPELKFIVRPGTDAAHVVLEVEASLPFTPSSASDANKILLPNQLLNESIKFDFEGGTLTLMITETTAEALHSQFSVPHTKSSPRSMAILLSIQSGLKLAGAELLSDTQEIALQMPGVPVKTVAELLADIDGLAVTVDAQQITFSAIPAQ
jgi:BlaR1 peptidase M56